MPFFQRIHSARWTYHLVREEYVPLKAKLAQAWPGATLGLGMVGTFMSFDPHSHPGGAGHQTGQIVPPRGERERGLVNVQRHPIARTAQHSPQLRPRHLARHSDSVAIVLVRAF